MEDYELRSKLDAIKNQEQRIADSLDRMERGPSPSGVRLVSDKTRTKIILGIVDGVLGFGLLLKIFFCFLPLILRFFA